MKRLAALLLCLFIFGTGTAFAESLKVEEVVISTAISDRTPVDSIETYPASVGKLYCFTRIVGAQDQGAVTHVWSFEGREMARVNLSVRSSDWRTWSSKRILPEWKGQWSVAVEDENGTVLNTVSFVLL